MAPPRLSDPRKVDADAQAVETRSDTDRPEASIVRLSVAASSEPVLGKRQPQGQQIDRLRVHSETMTQVEELQSVKDAGNVGAYKFEVCPGTKRAGACKAASPDRCKEWHVCYLCMKAGKAAA